jgi:hypothetical protein
MAAIAQRSDMVNNQSAPRGAVKVCEAAWRGRRLCIRLDLTSSTAMAVRGRRIWNAELNSSSPMEFDIDHR